jgi:hypothetical protein
MSGVQLSGRMLYGVSCDAHKTCLTFEVLILTSVIIYFKEYSDTEYSFTYHEMLVEIVGML